MDIHVGNKLALLLITIKLFCTINSSPLSADGNSTELCPCPQNKTENTSDAGSKEINHSVWPSSFSIGRPYHALIHGTPCMCHIGAHAPALRDDYKHTLGLGAHKLHTRAATWNEARKLCNEEGAHLAIINSVAEAQALLDIFNQAGPIKGATYQDVAFLGIHDLYKEGEWVTVLGESLYKTGYTKWSDKWGGQPDNGSGKQNCGVLLKDGGLDDVFCDAPFAFFCELPRVQFLM